MAIRRTTITITGATGGAGVATANAGSNEVVDGEIIAVHVNYTDSPPATTDITIAEKHNSPAESVLTLTDANTSGWFYPRAAAVNQAGSAITNSAVRICVSDYLKGTIAQANNDDGAIITVVWDDLKGYPAR